MAGPLDFFHFQHAFWKSFPAAAWKSRFPPFPDVQHFHPYGGPASDGLFGRPGRRRPGAAAIQTKGRERNTAATRGASVSPRNLVRVHMKPEIHPRPETERTIRRGSNQMRHIVRYSTSAYCGIREQSFSLHEDAIEFAENMLKQVKYVWLSEYGKYRQNGGRWITCWICYWWSPPVTKTDSGECPDAGWGRPHGRRSLIKYEPLLHKGSRFAHRNVRASPTREPVKALSSQGKRILKNTLRTLFGVNGDSEPVPVLPDWQ